MSSVLIDKLVRSLAVIGLVVASCTGLQAADGTVAGLSGAVKNPDGMLLDGVEVLVVPMVAAMLPLATVLSDSSGQFVIPQLVPGVYRLAAIKSGYTTWIAQIDTRSRRWIDVVLRPTPPADTANTLPEDAAWALRLPRRTVFRDTGPEVPELDPPLVFGKSGSGSDSGRSEATGLPLSMQVDHLFAVSPRVAGDRGSSELSGSETSLSVSTALGEKGNLHVRGRMQNLDSEVGEVAGSSGMRADASEFNVDFSYDTGVDGRVDVSAWYGLSDLAWDSFPAGTAVSLQQGQRSWGYRSKWQKQIDPTSSVAVKMVYDDRNSSMRQGPGLEASSMGASDPTLDGRLASRAVEVAGVYESQVSPDHHIEAGFAARRIETPGLDILGRSRPTWSFEAESQDNWTVARPLTLIYGLSYQQAISETDVGLIVPRGGASWNLNTVTLKFLASYHSIAHWEASEATRIVGLLPHTDLSAAGHAPTRPESEVGYLGSVEVLLAKGFSIEASTRWSPLQLGGIDRVIGEEFGDVPLFETDGTAAVKEARLTFLREGGRIRAYLDFSHGEVEGVLGPMQPFVVGMAQLIPGALTYLNGRWGMTLPSYGTDLQLEYRRVGGVPLDSDGAGPEQRSLELRVSQELMRLEELGNWRLLMAVRMGSLDSENLDAAAENYVTIGALSSGVSAGVSVQF